MGDVGSVGWNFGVGDVGPKNFGVGGVGGNFSVGQKRSSGKCLAI